MSGARIRRSTLALLGVAALAAAGALWLLTTNRAVEWLVAEAVRRSNGALTVEGVRGSLPGPLTARRLVYETDAVRVVAEDASLDIAVRALARRRLEIRSLEAQFLLVEFKGSPEPARPPATLALPLPVEIARVAVQVARLQGRELRGVSFDYEGGPREHVVRALTADAGSQRIVLGLRVAAEPPFAVSGRATLAGKQEPGGWSAALAVSGSLLETRVEATAEARAARAQGSAVIAAFGEPWLGRFELAAEGVDLSAFDERMPRSRLDIAASGSGGAGGLAGGELRITNRRAGPFTASRLPLVSLTAEFRLRGRQLDLPRLRASLGAGGAITGSARVGPDGGGADLVVTALDLRSLHAPLRATRLHGSVRARLTADEQLLHARVRERGIDIKVDALRRGDAISVRELRASAGGGELRGRGALSLAGPRRFSASATLARVDFSRFGAYPRSDMNGELKMEGALHPDWRGSLALELRRSTVRGVRVEGSARGEVSAHGARNVAIRLAAGANTLEAAGSFGRAGDRLAFDLDAKHLAGIDPGVTGALTARGTLTGALALPAVDIEVAARSIGLTQGRRIERLRATLAGTSAHHVLSVAAKSGPFDAVGRVEGKWDAPASWSGVVTSFENGGTYPASLAAPMPVRVSRGELAAGPAEVRIAGGHAALESLSWTNGRLDTRGRLSGMPVAPLFALAGLPAAATDLRLEGRWALAATPRLNGSVTLARQSGDVVVPGGAGPVALGLERLRLEARADDDSIRGTLEAAAAALRGRIAFSLSAPARNAALKLDGSISAGSVKALAPLVGARVAIDGRAELKVTAEGALDAPRLAGSLTAGNLRVDAPQFGVRLREGTLRAELGEAGVTLSELTFRAGQGRFTATGSMPRATPEGARVAWRAEDLALFDRPDMRLRLDGSGTLGVAREKLLLRGTLAARQGYFELDRDRAPRLGDDVVVIGRPRAVARPAARPRFEAKLLDMDVALDFGDRLRVVGAGIDTEVGGKLRLRTSAQGLVEAHGTLSSARGVYYAFGQRLDIERGRLIFDGPPDNPALDILAKRRNLQVEAGVEVTGTVQVPRVQLVSQPPVADSEKLAWLTLGRPLREASPTDAALLQTAAAALSSGGSAIPLSRRIAGQFGLDDVALRGGGVPGSQVVALGKRFSDKLYVEYQQGMAATSALLRLSYVLTRAISLRLEAGVPSSVGINYSRSYE